MNKFLLKTDLMVLIITLYLTNGFIRGICRLMFLAVMIATGVTGSIIYQYSVLNY